MAEKPILLIMAAGMGSRYGGLKQMDPVGGHGQVILDYSVFDAKQAGFETVVFIIKHEIEEAFKETVGARISKVMNVKYAYQQLDNLPDGYCVPEGRTKPWGTSHAILSAMNEINGPFAVINADDYYGPEAFKNIYEYLSTHSDTDSIYEYAMVGYLLKNTVTDNGHVARGVCDADGDGFLTDINERVRIEKLDNGIAYTEDEGKSWISLPDDTIVSMNLWGFTESFVKEALARFGDFLDKALVENPLKGEYFLPSVVDELLREKKARVKVLTSRDKWYGVTYKEDKPVVVAAIKAKTDNGEYPDNLWEV